MSSPKTRYTFMEFVKEYSIRIPLIQRDYVQGHDFTDKHKLEKRQEFIRLLMNALKRGTAYHVDFIYGSSIQNKEILGGKIFFIPLDGQQRLTTLFLLHWILISKSYLEKDEKIKYLGHLEGFSYETRLSSAAFCDKLTKTILEELPSGKVREIITDCSWYSNDWDYDPTINNMISMLEAMNSMLENEFMPFINQMLENALNSTSSITFDRLDMDEYSLTDGLYIKMNARGKELTTFEHWKALFIQFLEDTYQDALLISEFTDKIEHDWANGINESNVECLGDLITTDPTGEEAFIHFSTIDEMKEFIKEQPFEIVEYNYSYNIAEEEGKTKEFSGDTVFWVLKK